jgi:ribosome-associated protein
MPCVHNRDQVARFEGWSRLCRSAARVALAAMRDVPIRGDMIRLGQLLKLAGVVGGGGDAKAFLAEETVLVNGEPDNRRGRQLHPGDVIGVAGEELRLIPEG